MSAAGATGPPAGRYELRPQSIAEILDVAFQLLKNHFALLGGISLLGQVPTIAVFIALSLLLTPAALEHGELAEMAAAMIVAGGFYLLGMLLLMPFVIGAITAAIGDLYLGVEVTFETAARRGLERMVPLLVTFVVFTIVNLAGLALVVGGVGVVLVAAMPLIQGSAVVGFLLVIALLVGLPLLIGGSMLLAFMPGLLAAVVVFEEMSLFQAVLRTWVLVSSALSRTTGIAVTVYLIVLVAPAGVQLMFGNLPVLGALLWGAVQAICQAYVFTAAVVVYFDTRCRTESFDLEHLAQMVEGQQSGPAPIR
jgi:hypothetical protein